MQLLESVDLESRAVTKRAARGHAGLVEQVVGLRALVAAHLVADGDERVPLRPVGGDYSGNRTATHQPLTCSM